MNKKLTSVLKLVKHLVDARNYSAAHAALQDHENLFNTDPKYWKKFAFINELQRAYGPAIECVSRAIDLKADEPDYFYTRGRYYLKLKNYPAAEKDFTRTIQLCRDTQNDAYLVPGLFLRAFTYYHLNFPEKLREDCANVPEGFGTWIDKVITKEELLDMAALLERKL